MVPYLEWGINARVIETRSDFLQLHAAAMVPGRGPRRYMLGGAFLNNADLTDLLNELTGRRLLKLRIPGALIRGLGSLGDVLRRSLRLDIGISHESMLTLTRGVPCDDSRVEAELGVRRRPTAETLADSLRWMCEHGLVEPRVVGALAR